MTYIVDDRETSRFLVNRKVMVDEGVFEAEQSAIFDHSWLYLGHESEVPADGDHLARPVAGRALILARDPGGIRVFYNSCPHRGAELCRESRGSARFLKCAYHAWTYDTSGTLVALPGERGYGPDFDRSRYRLQGPPRAEQYRGFWFVSFDPDIVDLRTYLAGAAEYLDLVADQSAETMVVLRGSHEYSMDANWKLLVENSMDGYHGLALHQRYFKMISDAGARGMNGYRGWGFDLGNGHAVVAGVGDASLGRPYPPGLAERLAARRQATVERVGPERAARMHGSRNLFVFPSFMIVDLVMGVTLRAIWPVRPGYTEITGWELAPSDEDPAMRQQRSDSFLTFWGPAGLATPDDVAVLESCQRAFGRAGDPGWSDVSRGMTSPRPHGTDELQMRTFWRRWNEIVTGVPSRAEPHQGPPESWADMLLPREPRASREGASK